MKFIYPVSNTYVINGFGPRESFQLPDGRWTLPYHYGIDFPLPEGTPIFAIADGEVLYNQWDDSGYGGGWAIAIKHAGGFVSWYLHRVEKTNHYIGQKVKQGEVIGRVGTTGASTGPHLHLELHKNGEAVDPLPLLHEPEPLPELKPVKGKRMYISGWRAAKSAGQNKNLDYSKWGAGEQKLTAGKQNHLQVNSKGDVSVYGAGSVDVTASVSVKGKEGDIFTLGAVRGTYDTKRGWVQSAFLESVQGVIDSNGVAKLQLSIVNTIPTGQRLRFYIHPAKSAKPLTVTRYSVKGTKF